MVDAELTLRSYFDGSLDLYCEIDYDGVIQHVNTAWTTTLGYASDELLGQGFETFLHPADRKESREAFDDPDPPGKGLFRNRYRHKNGTYLTFLWSGHLDNRKRLVFAHARDVTEDVRKAAVLARVAAIQDVYLRLGTSHRGLFEQILVELLSALESTDGFIADIRNSGADDEPKLYTLASTAGFDKDEVARRAKDVRRTVLPQIGGTAEDYSFCVIPLFDLGKMIGIIGVAHRHGGFDADFLKRAKPVVEAIASMVGLYQSSVRENSLRERFVVIAENLPMMLTEYGPGGRITWANRYYRERVGLTEEQITSADRLIEATGAEAERARAFMLSGRTDWEEFTLLHSNGDSFQSIWTNVRLKDGRSIGIGQDTTERRIAESKMIQSSKMASLGEMSAGVSHEINNPLAIIQGSAFRALQNLANSSGSEAAHRRDEVEGDLNRIILNCDRIARIVRGLRAFSRSAEHEPFMPTSLSHVIDDVMNLAYERFINHKIQLQIDVSETLSLDCRPVQLGQVLMNLLNNAFDAVSDRQESDRAVWVRATSLGSAIQISVEDSGKGIPEHVRDRILEPFFTTKDVGKGTGLGLSISKGIIESHGGRLWLDVEAARTRFVVELPIRQNP